MLKRNEDQKLHKILAYADKTSGSYLALITFAPLGYLAAIVSMFSSPNTLSQYKYIGNNCRHSAISSSLYMDTDKTHPGSMEYLINTTELYHGSNP